MTARVALILAGLGNTAAALTHVIGWAMGPEAIAFLGAPPYIVQSMHDGTADAPVTIAIITAVLALFAAYAFSGAGLVPRLPLLRTVLTFIAIIFILRGLVIFIQIQGADFSVLFDVVHLGLSVVVLVLGLLYAYGAWRVALVARGAVSARGIHVEIRHGVGADAHVSDRSACRRALVCRGSARAEC